MVHSGPDGGATAKDMMEVKHSTEVPPHQDAASGSSELLAVVIMLAYFVVMVGAGAFAWYRSRKRLQQYLERRQLRRPQRFENGSRVLKIKYCSCESLE
ncbi:unnamed protein product [Mesocestoides corti]|uniref:Secreted protein n=1 Tax=Mesocestoides corti TaxID=53468 RepID=A0A0R3U8J2_MESCO|nr:unnamed protein product [Mesocestoides corti]